MSAKDKETAAKLIKALQGTPATIPPGWHTSIQLAAKWSLSRAHTNKLIRDGLDAGLIDRTTFRVRCPGGQLYPVPHYRIKKGKSFLQG